MLNRTHRVDLSHQVLLLLVYQLPLVWGRAERSLRGGGGSLAFPTLFIKRDNQVGAPLE